MYLSLWWGNQTQIFPTSGIIQLNTMCNDRKFFLCTGQAVPAALLPNYADSHIIGELRYVMDEGEKVTALALYEISQFVTNPPDAMPAVRVEIVGDARRLKCTWCDHMQRWEIGKAAIKQLWRRYQPE